jgi:hypothetical protein
MRGYAPICGESGTSGEKCLKFRRAVGKSVSHPKEALVAPELSQEKRLNLGLADGTVERLMIRTELHRLICSSRRIAARRGDSASTRQDPAAARLDAAPYDDEKLTNEDLLPSKRRGANRASLGQMPRRARR